MGDAITATVNAARVLVVDDEPSLLVLVREALGLAGKRVIAAESPDEALALLEELSVDLVLTDIHMPGSRSGLDLVQDVRDAHPSIPVIVVTGDGSSANVGEALDRGAAGFLVKPFEIGQLVSKVDETLRRKDQAEADLRERLVRPTIATALANAIEVKDSGIQGHVERLTAIALVIGHQLRLSRHDMESLELGAVLHDVGKIGIPDRILLKPRELDPDEREIMKAHTVIGDQMLRHLDLDEIRPVVRHHHENWDGGGYPEGLAGHDIPLLARIVAVADSIEAMTAQRPYREPLTLLQVRSELSRGRGRQWDPHITDIALDLIESGVISFTPHGVQVSVDGVPDRGAVIAALNR
jgi:putative two-component system response regulator